MVFKKFDNQQVYQLEISNGSAAGLKVGSLFSYADGVATKVTTKEGAEGKELYLVAQSDAVTYKTGTAYKSYAIDPVVEGLVIVAYRVDSIENLEGWEA